MIAKTISKTFLSMAIVFSFSAIAICGSLPRTGPITYYGQSPDGIALHPASISSDGCIQTNAAGSIFQANCGNPWVDVNGPIFGETRYVKTSSVALDFQTYQDIWAFRYAPGVVPSADDTGQIFNISGGAIEFRVGGTTKSLITATGDMGIYNNLYLGQDIIAGDIVSTITSVGLLQTVSGNFMGKETDPTAPAALELFEESEEGWIRSYKESDSTYKPLNLQGLNVKTHASGVLKSDLDDNGLSVYGQVTATSMTAQTNIVAFESSTANGFFGFGAVLDDSIDVGGGSLHVDQNYVGIQNVNPQVALDIVGDTSISDALIVVGSATVQGSGGILVNGGNIIINGSYWVGFGSETKANILASTPGNAGRAKFCSDCTSSTICISTGTGALGQVADSSDRTAQCN